MSAAVTLYETEMSVLLSLEEEKRGRILSAILCDTMGQPLPEMDASERAIFTLVNAQVKRAAELSAKRKKSAESRWNSQANECNDNADNCDLCKEYDENSLQNYSNDMQINANSMQNNANECNKDTNLCTNTNTITNTSTNTNTNTSTGESDSPARRQKKPTSLKVNFADFVTLTEQEHETLIAEYGKDVVEWCINKLNNYKGSSGKKYKSDYLTIRGWVIDSYYEEQRKRNQQYSVKPPGGSAEPVRSKNPFINAVMGNGNGE